MVPPAFPELGAPSRALWRDRRVYESVVVTIEVIALILLWQYLINDLRVVNPMFFPPPTRIVDGFEVWLGGPGFWQDIRVSLVAWVTGYALATVVGVSAGFALAGSLPTGKLVGPLLWTFFAIPWLAYRPLSVAWFGFGLGPIIFLVFIASVFTIMFNTAAGAAVTDPSLIRAARVYGLRGWKIHRRIVLPSAIPFIVAGMSQAAVLATVALVAAEILGSSVGVGARIIVSANSYAVGEAFAAIVVAVAWSVIISQAVAALGRRIAPWQESGGV